MKYVFGNWKMNLNLEQASKLSKDIVAGTIGDNVEIAIFPAFTHLYPVGKELQNLKIKLGGQDLSPSQNGAFTGDISSEMLKDLACKYVLVGHSERRTIHGESNEIVAKKADAAIKAGLIPVICVGENLEQREQGNYLEIIVEQLKQSLPSDKNANYIVAYEPVWAIGTGKTSNLQEIEEVHKTIASTLYYAKQSSGQTQKTPVLYGGSVKASNAGEIMNNDFVDGVLVGGASLSSEEFGKIITCAGL